MIKSKQPFRNKQFTFRSYVNYFADPDPLDFDHEHDASGDGISDADTYRLSSDPLIDGRAHPLRKDVFVEVDWMEGVDRLSDEAKWRIGTRFYENDIWLHIDDGKMGGGGEVPYISTIYNDHDYEALTLDGYKDDFFTPEREGLFRYGLMADYVYHDDPGWPLDVDDWWPDWFPWDPFEGRNVLGFASSGRFVVSQRRDLIADLTTNPGTVFMHELGHTVGLRSSVYDGIDSWRFHDEYPSLMSYWTLWTRSNFYNYSDGTNHEDDFDDWGYIREKLHEGI